MEQKSGTNDALASVAFTRGRRDRMNGFSPAANPFPVGSSESEQYRQGQLSAESEINDSADRLIKRDKEVPQWERELRAGARDYGYGGGRG